MSLTPAFELGVWNAWIFMIWPIVLPFLSNFTIKEKGVSKKLRTSVPIRFEKTLNVITTAAVVLGFIYSVFLPLKIDSPWLYIGFIIFLFGLTSDISVLYTIRNAKLDKPFTTGPYRFSRHPIYMALLMVVLSVMIMSFSWIFLIIAIIFVIHFLLVVPAEEKYCLKKYGKEYQDYLNKTPRWIGIPKK
jgi:protein-S-isoprenylcysteine O-methyltransferase Ste14